MEKQFTPRIWESPVIRKTPNLQTPAQIQGVSCAPGGQRQRRRRIASSIQLGASVSQMAAAKLLDTISKLLSVAGETSDAISAYTHVKVTDAPRLSRLPQEECPEIWIRISPRQRPKRCINMDDFVVPLERN